MERRERERGKRHRMKEKIEGQRELIEGGKEERKGRQWNYAVKSGLTKSSSCTWRMNLKMQNSKDRPFNQVY